jgi:hypothetical protein
LRTENLFAFAAAAAADLNILLNRKNAMKMKIKKIKKEEEGKTKGINEVKTDKKKKIPGPVPALFSVYLFAYQQFTIVASA